MELNPNHGVTAEMREQWHKIAAILMFKFSVTKIVITAEDIEEFANSGLANITMRPVRDTLTLELVNDKEARRLAREEGGLPT